MPRPVSPRQADPLARSLARAWTAVPEELIGFPRTQLGYVLLWTLAAAFALSGLLGIVAVGYGSDSHAYYLAWQGTMYDELPGQLNAYLYSPAFAQAVWPLTQLPWPVFAVMFSAAAAMTLSWLLAPVPLRFRVPLLLMCLPEIITGNVFWLLALVAVLGLRHPSLWVVALFTKVLPALGPIWFAARGEWRKVAVAALAATVVVGVSYASVPSLWQDWIEFLLASSQEDGLGNSLIAPPLWARVPVALVLTVYAARRGLPQWLPVAMLVASPMLGHGSYTLLAAVPRLARRAGSGRDA